MIYIHIPFCKSRCLYCDFFSSTALAQREDFLRCLHQEIQARGEEILRARANTIYIGGGTPSQLEVEQIMGVFDALQCVVQPENDAEVTIECNPDDITPTFLQGLRCTPVNRISMGIQTMDDALLRLLGRRHTSVQAREAVGMLRQYGYTNISLDLMYGLPGQTIEMWRRDVDELLSLKIPHLSAYSLQWEEGTPLCRMLEEGRVREASDELSLEMYRYVVQASAQAGMQHYEISNFAIPGMRARHNSGYWREQAYVGLGPGAHSYDGYRHRSSNPSNLALYIQQGGVPHQEIEFLDDDALYEERVLKGLRTMEGLDLDTLDAKYREYALNMARPHIKAGRMHQQGSLLTLTEEGVFVSNDIMSDMML